MVCGDAQVRLGRSEVDKTRCRTTFCASDVARTGYCVQWWSRAGNTHLGGTNSGSNSLDKSYNWGRRLDEDLLFPLCLQADGAPDTGNTSWSPILGGVLPAVVRRPSWQSCVCGLCESRAVAGVGGIGSSLEGSSDAISRALRRRLPYRVYRRIRLRHKCRIP